MESYLRFSIIVVVCGLCLPVMAAQPVAVAPAADANALNLPAFPFLAEITSDDVYIRSGPGTQYYNCGKARKDDKVKVVGNKFSWLQIVPPAGSFSWVSKQYIQVDAKNNTSGSIIGDAVRVYAGSDEVQPMHSTSMQGKLNKGDKVTIIGEEKDGYCKIAPPEGAYLWVSSQHAKPLSTLVAPVAAAPSAPAAASAPSSSMPATAHPMPASPFPTNPGELKAPVSSPNEPNMPGTPSPTPLPSVEEQKINELAALKEKVEAEKAKPIDDQNFVELKKAIAVIAADKQAVMAARKAAALFKMVEKCELSRDVAKAVKIQDEQSSQTQQKIDSAKNEELSKIEDKGIFTVIGTFKESNVFTETPGVRYYKVFGTNGKELCYARATGPAAGTDLSQFIDKKVGLVGSVEANADLGGAVVMFTNILEVQ
jgi:uncharacterized protein YgiM (DUF1202 family)